MLNRNQRIAFACGMVLLAASALYPPWLDVWPYGSAMHREPDRAGHATVWAHDKFEIAAPSKLQATPTFDIDLSKLKAAGPAPAPPTTTPTFDIDLSKWKDATTEPVKPPRREDIQDIELDTPDFARLACIWAAIAAAIAAAIVVLGTHRPEGKPQ